VFFFVQEKCNVSAQFVGWRTFFNDVIVPKILLYVIKYILYESLEFFYVNTISDLVKCDIFVVINFMTRALFFHQSKN